MIRKLNIVGNGTKTASIPKPFLEQMGMSNSDVHVNMEYKDGGVLITPLTKEQRYESMSSKFKESLDTLAK